MKSIIQSEKECYLCGETERLECHHIFGGVANRPLSEKYGLKVWLCGKHHREVHAEIELRRMLQRVGQVAFMKHYGKTADEFREIFGRNYL